MHLNASIVTCSHLLTRFLQVVMTSKTQWNINAFHFKHSIKKKKNSERLLKCNLTNTLTSHSRKCVPSITSGVQMTALNWNVSSRWLVYKTDIVIIKMELNASPHLDGISFKPLPYSWCSLAILPWLKLNGLTQRSSTEWTVNEKKSVLGNILFNIYLFKC